MNFKKNENTLLLILSAVFLSVTLIACILMLAATATGGLYTPVFQSSVTPPEDDAASALPGTLPASATVLQQTADGGEAYIKKIIFVGDSTTYHMISRGVLPGGTETTQVWGPKNGTLMLSSSVTSLKIVYPETETEMTIAEAAAKKKPELMVLTIGLNGSHTFTETVYKGSYRKLIDAIKAASPDTKIILQSVFPVAANETAWTSLTPAELNLRIDQVNQWAQELTAEYENVRYLDTQSVLRDENDFLKDAYQSGDGIHLTAAGYEAILQYIRTHAWSN